MVKSCRVRERERKGGGAEREINSVRFVGFEIGVAFYV